VPPWQIAGAVAYSAALARGARQKYTAPRLVGGDLAFLQYTGGTTGRAKGAMLTQRNMVANTLQAAAWARPNYAADAGVVVTPLPLYHVYSLTANLFCFVELGGHNLLITDPRDFKGFIALLKKYKFAFMTGVNTLFNALLHTPGFAALDFSALRVVMGWRYGRAARGREPLGSRHRVRHRAGLRSHRSVADRHRQSAALEAVHRLRGAASSRRPEVAIFDEQDRELPIGPSRRESACAGRR
jgi:non-ribosomal peptide synthetase component F